MARFVVQAEQVTSVLLARFSRLQARQQQFTRAHLLAIDKLLRTQGTVRLQERMPYRTGKLKRSIRLYLSRDGLKIRALFYVFLNPLARAALAQFVEEDLPGIVRQAVAQAAATLPTETSA